VNLTEIVWDGVNWTNMAQKLKIIASIVNTAKNMRVT